MVGRTSAVGIRGQIGAAVVGSVFGSVLFVAGLLEAARFSSEQWILRAGLPFFWFTQTRLIPSGSDGYDPILSLVDSATPLLALLQWPLYLWLLVVGRQARWAWVVLAAVVTCHLLVLVFSG